VIAEHCIGGVNKATACDDLFRKRNVGVSLTVTPCWCYGSETMDMDPLRPKAVFGFNGTERPGAVYLAAVLAGHTQKGIPAFGIYGRNVQDAGDSFMPADVQSRILDFTRCGLTAALMRGKAYLSMGGTSMGGTSMGGTSMGGTSMGIAGSMVDYSFWEKWLGMRVEDIDMSEFIGRMNKGQFDQAQFETAMEWVKKNCPEGKDYNGSASQRSREQIDREWSDSVKMTLIARDLMVGNPKLAEMGLMEQGQGHQAIASACNGYKLQGTASDGLLHLINSGPATLDGTGQQTGADGSPTMKPFWEITDDEVKKFLEATTWHPSMTEYFPGGGLSTRFRTRGGMKSTMTRINLISGLGPALQIAEGHTVELPDNVHDVLDQRTNPTWPTTWFAPTLTGSGAFRSTYDVMNHWGANHCVLTAGHVGHLFITLASILRIPVYMHNVAADRVFRPSAWNGFGTENPESADFRACKNFGPLYGRA
jgi:L-fucose/D-arabinose isomerase